MTVNNIKKSDHTMRKKHFILCSVVFCFTFGVFRAEQANAGEKQEININNLELRGTIELKKGIKCNLKKSSISKTGKIVSYSGEVKLYPDKTLTISRGKDSSKADESTGTYHNHGVLDLYKGSKIEGDGQILNYAGFVNDDKNTKRADAEHHVDGEYVAENSLKDKESLGNAAYFDLVNDESKGAKTSKFFVYSGAELRSTTDPIDNAKTFKRVKIGDEHLGKDIKLDVFNEDFDQTNTKLTEAYDLGLASKYMEDYARRGFEIIHSQRKVPENATDANPGDHVYGSFYSIDGYTQYADRKEAKPNEMMPTKVEPGFNGSDEELSKATKFKFNVKSYKEYDAADKNKQVPAKTVNEVVLQHYTPVYIPPIDEKTVISKTISSEFGDVEKQYKTEVMATLEDEEGNRKIAGKDTPAFSEWTKSDPVTTYHGDNSWFNGVYKLKKGGAIIASTGKIFGGKIELGDPTTSENAPGNYTSAQLYEDLNSEIDETRNRAKNIAKTVYPTELEWQGGVDDEYNKPEIVMNGNSTMYFKIPEDKNGNRVFSVYGSLKSTEYDRLIFEQGTVKIKGDWSGFKGQVGLVEGSRFEISSSDALSSSEYHGSFPSANIYLLKKDGSFMDSADLSKPVIINSDGINNVVFNNGYSEVSNTNGNFDMKNVEIDRPAMVTAKSDIKTTNVTVKGIFNAEKELNADNLAIKRGVLVIGENVEFKNASVGSTVVSWGNGNYGDKLHISKNGQGKNTFKIEDGHSLKFYADFSLTEKDDEFSEVYKSDRINVSEPNAIVFAGNGIEVGGMNFQGTPTEKEYKFIIYNGTGTNTDMPVMLGAHYDGGEEIFNVHQNSTFTTTADNLPAPQVTNDNDIKYSYISARTNLTTGTTNKKIDEIDFTKTIDFGAGNTYQVGTKPANADTDYLGYVFLRRIIGSSAINPDTVHEASIINNPAEIGDTITDTDLLFDSEYDPNVETMHERYANEKFYKTEWFDNKYAGFGEKYINRSPDINTNTNSDNKGDGSQPGEKSSYGEDGAIRVSRIRRYYALSSRKRSNRYKIWHKTLGGHNKIGMSGAPDLKVSDYGAIFGLDGEVINLSKANLKFMPTVFAGIHKKHLRFKGTRYYFEGYFGGLKAALYNRKHAIELFGFYEFMKTQADISSGRVNIKSHVLSLGTKYGYNIELKPNLFLRPNIFFDYAYAKTPGFKTGENTSKHKINKQHRFDVAPGLTLTKRCGSWTTSAFVAHHKKFGTKGKSVVNNKALNIDFSKKRHLEYGVEINKTIANGNGRVGIRLSRQTAGIRGFKVAISAGIKF